MNLVSIYKRNRVFLFCVVFILLGLLFRCIHIFKYSIQSRDSYDYKEEIAEIQKDKSHSGNYPIVSMYLMSLPSRLFGLDIIKGGVIVNMILGVSIIALIVKTCYNITRSSLLMFYAGIITASYSDFIYFSTQLLRENSYLFFVCAALEMLTRRGKDSLLKLFLLGFYTICAVLCRFEGLEIIIMYTVFKASAFLFDKHKTGKKFVKFVANYVLYLFFTTVLFLVASLSFGDGLHSHGLGLERLYHFVNVKLLNPLH